MTLKLAANPILANLYKAEAGGFRKAIDAEGNLEDVKRTGGLKSWLVSRIHAGKVNEGSLAGKTIRGLVGSNSFRTISMALKLNREMSARNAVLALIKTEADENTLSAGSEYRVEIERKFTERASERGVQDAPTREVGALRAEIIQDVVMAQVAQKTKTRASANTAVNRAGRTGAGQDVDRATQASQPAPSASHSRRGGESERKLMSRLPAGLTLAELYDSQLLNDAQKTSIYQRLNLETSAYHAALDTPISSQTPEQRAQTVVELHESLNKLEEQVIAIRGELKETFSNRPDTRPTDKYILTNELNILESLIDSERALIQEVSNNFAAQHSGAHTNVTWQHALEFKLRGLNIGAGVTVGSSQDKTVAAREYLGQGGINIVHKLTFADGTQGVFKPVPVDNRQLQHFLVPKHAAIPAIHPRLGARNVASSNIDKLLGANLLVDTEYLMHNGQLGILMEYAPHKSVYDIDVKNKDSIQLHRDLNRLQLLDAINGQFDRHGENVLAEVDAQGNYVRLKGIDNDMAFGSNPHYNDLSRFRNYEDISVRAQMKIVRNRNHPEHMHAAANSSGLPPMADAEMTDKILSPDFPDQAKASVTGLLSDDEIQRMTERIRQVQEHLEGLKQQGNIVSDWSSNKALNGKTVKQLIESDPSHTCSVSLMPQPPGP